MSLEKEINQFSNVCVNFLFGAQADYKKLKKNIVKKELVACGHYASLCLAQELINKFNNGEYSNFEEVIGDLQSSLVKNYSTLKTSLNLKVPLFDLEKCVEITAKNLEKIKNERK
jgi:hypothetical protein